MTPYTRYQTEEQKLRHRQYSRAYYHRKKAGLITRTTPKSVTSNNVPTLVHEYHGVCTSCGMDEKLYKGLCAFCRSFANIHVTDDDRSRAARAGADSSPFSFKSAKRSKQS